VGSSEKGLVHCSHLSALWHRGWDVSAGASSGRAAGKISVFLLASLHPREQSTSRSQKEVSRVNVTTVVRVVGFAFAGSCSGDAVAG